MDNLDNELLATTIYDSLRLQALLNPGAAAILSPARAPLDFKGLLNQIDAVHAALAEHGLGRGVRVALLLSRGPEAAIAAIGIASCAICVPLNEAGAPEELAQSLAETRADALLLPATAAPALQDCAVRSGLCLLEYSIGDGAAIALKISHGKSAFRPPSGRPGCDDLAFVLRTSGTTARAKIVPITHRNVVARADKSRRTLGLSSADRCFNLMPLCYHHGLNSGLMSSLAAGCSVICPSAFDAETFFAGMTEFSPTWYTGSFTYHQTILEWLAQRPNGIAHHRLRFVRSSSGPLAAQIRSRTEEIIGVPMLQAYGTTETGTIAANPPVGLRKAETVGRSPDDDFAIMDEHGRLLEADRTGEVVVRGTCVFAGYENNPEATALVLRDGWYHTGDQGFIDSDGFLKLLGRTDDVINRGGEKISPAEVDERALAHAGVQQAISFPVPHPTLHQTIALAVVPKRDTALDAGELRRVLAAQLAPFKVPSTILSVGELPRGPTGKLNRKELAGYFGLDRVQATADLHAPVASQVQEILLKLWREVLERDDLGCDDDFFQAGGDSLSAVDLLNRIEAEFQYQLPLSLLVEAPTVRKLEDRIEKATIGATDDTICISSVGSQPPLFALFGRYGHVLRLVPVLRSLGADQPVYAMQPPEMDWRAVGCSTLPEMAAYYVEEIQRHRPQGPYRLMGVSFGGLVAFEIAQQLQRKDEIVESLSIVDTAPPNCLFDDGPAFGQSWVIDDGPPKNAIEAVNQNIADAHLRARRNYVLDCRSGQNVYPGAITYFLCSGNPIATVHDRRRLWRRLTSGQFRLIRLPGSHGDVDREPQFSVFCDLMRSVCRGEKAAGIDPATVFDRSYRIENRDQCEYVVDAAGEAYRIAPADIQGCVASIATDAQTIRFRGWALEPDKRTPAQTIAVFLDQTYLGWGASGVLREDIRNHLPDATKFAGFDFYFGHGGVVEPNKRARLFVLSDDGSAAELAIEIEKKLLTWAGLLQAAAETEKLHRDIEVLTETTQELHGKIEAMTETRQHLRGDIEALTETTQKLRQDLADMKASTSWRVTAPLRWLGQTVKKTRVAD